MLLGHMHKFSRACFLQASILSCDIYDTECLWTSTVRAPSTRKTAIELHAQWQLSTKFWSPRKFLWACRTLHCSILCIAISIKRFCWILSFGLEDEGCSCRVRKAVHREFSEVIYVIIIIMIFIIITYYVHAENPPPPPSPPPTAPSPPPPPGAWFLLTPESWRHHLTLKVSQILVGDM